MTLLQRDHLINTYFEINVEPGVKDKEVLDLLAHAHQKNRKTTHQTACVQRPFQKHPGTNCDQSGTNSLYTLARLGRASDLASKTRRSWIFSPTPTSWLRNWGSGFRSRVQGPEFRVQAAGFRVQGAGFRVQGSGFKVQVFVMRVQGLCVQGYLAHKKKPPPRATT